MFLAESTLFKSTKDDVDLTESLPRSINIEEYASILDSDAEIDYMPR